MHQGCESTFIWSGSRVLMTKNKTKFIAATKINFLGDQKLQFTYLYASIKKVQVTEEAFSSQKRTSSTSKHEISYIYFFFCWSFFAFLDPDPLTRLNPDPIRIPQPQPCNRQYFHLYFSLHLQLLSLCRAWWGGCCTLAPPSVTPTCSWRSARRPGSSSSCTSSPRRRTWIRHSWRRNCSSCDILIPSSVGDPGSRSISQTCGSGSGSFPFLIKVLNGLKQCLQSTR